MELNITITEAEEVGHALCVQLKIILFNLLFPGYYEFYCSDTWLKQPLY